MASYSETFLFVIVLNLCAEKVFKMSYMATLSFLLAWFICIGGMKKTSVEPKRGKWSGENKPLWKFKTNDAQISVG